MALTINTEFTETRTAQISTDPDTKGMIIGDICDTFFINFDDACSYLLAAIVSLHELEDEEDALLDIVEDVIVELVPTDLDPVSLQLTDDAAEMVEWISDELDLEIDAVCSFLIYAAIRDRNLLRQLSEILSENV